MRKIKELVERIDDELTSAEEYAECYIDYKANNNTQMATRFYDMANDELNHAITIHDVAMKEIEKVNAVFNAPPEMREKWDKSHSDYIARNSRIKSMLGM